MDLGEALLVAVLEVLWEELELLRHLLQGLGVVPRELSPPTSPVIAGTWMAAPQRQTRVEEPRQTFSSIPRKWGGLAASDEDAIQSRSQQKAVLESYIFGSYSREYPRAVSASRGIAKERHGENSRLELDIQRHGDQQPLESHPPSWNVLSLYPWHQPGDLLLVDHCQEGTTKLSMTYLDLLPQILRRVRALDGFDVQVA